jgi:hypothetical protein
VADNWHTELGSRLGKPTGRILPGPRVTSHLPVGPACQATRISRGGACLGALATRSRALSRAAAARPGALAMTAEKSSLLRQGS